MEIIFKDRIRALRQERGETQVQVAEAIGVAESHYQRFERGANLPNLENVWKLADHFGVTIDYLVVHSVLHLLGYDHLDEGPQKARMRAREEAILGELGIGR